jgi:hypothetical protein
MRILGLALSGWGLPFLSAKAHHSHWRGASLGEVVCETQEQCDAIAARARAEGWTITTRIATADEVAEAKKWRELW